MSLTSALLFLTLFPVLLPSAQGLRCVICDGHRDEGEAATKMPCHPYSPAMDCAATIYGDNKDRVCVVKISGDKECGLWSVRRDSPVCADGALAQGNGCYCCEEDLCNKEWGAGASTSRGWSAGLILSLGITLLWRQLVIF